MRAGLALRVVVASGVLALVVSAAFAVLLSSVAELRDAQQRAKQSHEVLVVANLLERLVVDLETGQRGFIITGQDDFLQPWHAARTAFPEQAARLQRLVADNPEQQASAQRITQATTSYLQDYAVPLMNTARTDPGAARTVSATAEGKQRIDAIRVDFDRLIATATVLASTRERRSEAAANRAVVAAAGGLTGSILLIVAFAGYLTGAIARPVRQAAAMAGRIAGGDLGVRLPERGVGEIRQLERSFNTMAGSLQRSREDLAASRARIVTAADQARRRIERDLHDGVQQRLVSLVLDLRAIEAAAPSGSPELGTQLGRVADGLAAALDDLRELSRGIHPAILSEGGLVPALKALARRSTVPVELDVDLPTRLPEPIEVAAYYVASEALANTAKHARASVVHVHVGADDSGLRLTVHDDGVGGADPRGSGLIGLTDRVEALGGTLSITSTTGHGTSLLVHLPVETANR